MIEKYKLEELLKKYNININVALNEQLLSRGEYQEIDDTLDYLINELHIDRKNIEKCPSVMYYSVDNIKKNAGFLKKSKVNFDKVEKCLHVLSTDNDELIKTYNYVLTNYGVDIINKTVSVLSIPTSRIIEIENLNIPCIKKKDIISISVGRNEISDIKDILQSEEFKTHSELFTSQVLARGNLKEIKDILASEEFKNHPELFTSTVLAYSNLKEIKGILQSEEFKAYPDLFTSQVLAYSNLKEIKDILQSEEFKAYPELFTSQVLAHGNLKEIKDIFQSEEFKNHPELFTSTVLAEGNLKEIKDILQSDEFKNHPELFTSTVLAQGNLKEIKDILQSDEFKNHPELFTSAVLSHGNLKEIKDILASEEFKNHPDLFTSTVLAQGNLKEIKNILQSEEFKNHRELFTSEVLAHGNLKDIRTLLALPYWQEEKYKKLLTSSIVAKSKQMIIKLPIQFKMAEEYGISDYLTTSFLLAAPSQNYAKINYLLDNNYPLVEDNKLNRIFSYQPGALKKKFGIDLKELMNKYPFDDYKENEFTKYLSY